MGGNRAAAIAGRLDATLKALGIPIAGVVIENPDDKATWLVQFADATPEQEAAAAVIVAGIDPNAVPVARDMEPIDFVRRFRPSETVGFEMLCVQTTELGAMARVAKMTLALVKDRVGLDHPDTIRYLAFMKTAHLLGDGTDASADQRIAEIRA